MQVSPIAHISTPYKQKFAIPRQPGLVTAALGVVTFNGRYCDPNYIDGLDAYSHIWLLFEFHQHRNRKISAKVRPPRLGGNKSIGVLATRSSFRPNNIGMSVVELVAITKTGRDVSLTVRGTDLLDGTPIIDIKPYIPYSDAIPHARCDFAPRAPDANFPVSFSETAINTITEIESHISEFKTVIQQVLSQDPRPAYKKTEIDNKIYNTALYDYDICWQVLADTIHVVAVETIE